VELKLRWVQASFAVHVIIILIAMNISSLPSPINKPLIIDLSMDYNASKKIGQEFRPKPLMPEIKKQQKETLNQESQKTSVEKTQAIPQQSPAQDGGTNKPNSADIPAQKSTSSKNINETSAAPSKGHVAEGGYVKMNFSYIRDIIQKNTSYPQMARKRGWEGKVVVSFIVCVDGYAKDMAIKESSGIDVLDRSALEAIKKASPFPKPPAEAVLIIPVVYKLN